MATEVTAITARHFELFDEEARRLAHQAPQTPNALRVTYTASVQESMALNRIAGGAIIVAASGMCDGGRIRHHLKHHLPNPRTTILIIGFQAAGTLGRRLVDRAPVVRIFGEEVPVRAEIVTLGGFSAHADQSALLQWLRHFRAPPGHLFLVHGEAEIAAAFAAEIERKLRWRSSIPAHEETVTL
jgi:metallo-beta-lactamase family protein